MKGALILIASVVLLLLLINRSKVKQERDEIIKKEREKY